MTASIEQSSPRVWLNVLIPLCQTLLAVSIIVANGFAFAVVKRQGMNIKPVTRILFRSLLLTNLYVGISIVVTQIVVIGWGHVMSDTTTNRICHVSIGIGFSGAAGCVISLMTINIERYISIEFPLRSIRLLTPRRAYVMLAIKWLVMFSVVVIYSQELIRIPYYNREWKMCLPLYNNVQRSIMMVCAYLYMMLFVCLPSLVSISIYARILVIVHRTISEEAKIKARFSSSSERRSKNKGPNKAAYTFLLVTATFVFAWTPTCSIYIYRLYVDEVHLYPQLEIASFFTLVSNHLCTTAVYVARDMSFREATVLFKRNKKINVNHIM